MSSTINRILIGLLLFSLGACNKTIEDLQVNPNQAKETPPDLILGTLLTDLQGSGTVGQLQGTASWSSVQKYNQYFLGAYAYYGDNQYNWANASFDSYIVLKNANQMEEEARRIGSPSVNPYEAISKFVRAYYLYNQTSLNGDIPLSEAYQGIENLAPKYDTQKDVFKYVLNTLDSANTDFAKLIVGKDVTITGSAQDIYYGGDLSKWQKAVNSFKLRVLISLSKKSSDADLNLATQFSAIINNSTKYPIFNSVSDDLLFNYIAVYNQYPLNPVQFKSTASRYAMAKTYVKSMTDLNDPRVYVNCEPAWEIVDSFHLNPLDFKSFIGESTGASIAVIEQEANARTISFINRWRFYNTYTGVSNIIVGYTEMCFNIAEAINRGWISGDAESWYKKGITTSFQYNGMDIANTNFTAHFLPTGGLQNITSYPFTFNFNSYYAQPSVKYTAGTLGLSQIALQKYIALFQNSGWEAYFNYRRTGVPAFQGGTGIGNNGNIPLRWGYPQKEQNQNGANWKAALASQGFATDDINGKMWLIK